MKILILSNLYPPLATGGAEISAHQLAVGLKNSGEDVSVVTLGDKNNDYVVDGIKVYSVKNKNIYSPLAFRNNGLFKKAIWHIIDLYNFFIKSDVKRLLKKIKPDIAHCHNIDGFSSSIWSVAKRLGIPIVQHIHDYHFLCVRSDLLHGNGTQCIVPRKLCKIRFQHHLKMMNRYIDYIISPSRFCFDTLFSSVNKSELKFNHSIIPNGTPVADINDISINWQAKKLKVLFLGKLTENKGFDVFVGAINRINKSIKNMEFHIAGDGNLKKIAEELSIKYDNVKYHGFVNGDEKIDLLKSSHLMVFPSTWRENNPVSITEALALGIPVLASDIGGIPELLKEYSSRLLVSPGDVDAISNSMLEFEMNRNILERISEKIFLKRKEYSMGKQVSATFKVYESVLEY